MKMLLHSRDKRFYYTLIARKIVYYPVDCTLEQYNDECELLGRSGDKMTPDEWSKRRVVITDLTSGSYATHCQGRSSKFGVARCKKC
jgi:hypothetical protein